MGQVVKQKKKHPSKAKNETWYGYNCKRIRWKWHSAKNVYRFNKNEAALNSASKEYKKTMRQSYIKFKRFQKYKIDKSQNELENNKWW